MQNVPKSLIPLKYYLLNYRNIILQFKGMSVN